MTDKFTLTLNYNRDEILDWAVKMKAKGGSLTQVRAFLDDIFPAWRMDTRTSCMVELMFRGPDDIFYDLFTEKLAECDIAENRCPINVDQFRL